MWPRWVKWTIGIGAGLLLSCFGISMATFPAQEISYLPERVLPVCTGAGGCIGIYNISVGNTGSRNTDEVKVVLKSEAVNASLLPLKVLNSGVAAREFTKTENGEETIVEFKDLESGKRIDIKLVLQATTIDGLPEPDTLVSRIESSGGVVVRGHPELIRFGRFLYAFFEI